MAHHLGFGPIYDADKPLEPRFEQTPPQRLIPLQVEQERWNACIMTEPLIAVAMRRADTLDLHVAAPVGRRRDRSLVGAEPDQGGLVAEAFATQLADVQLR